MECEFATDNTSMDMNVSESFIYNDPDVVNCEEFWEVSEKYFLLHGLDSTLKKKQQQSQMMLDSCLAEDEDDTTNIESTFFEFMNETKTCSSVFEE